VASGLAAISNPGAARSRRGDALTLRSPTRYLLIAQTARRSGEMSCE
jgi:hypothetical protein